MERDKLQELLAWKSNPHRKPLIVRGARQVGKTWLLQELGKRYYDNMVYINFENTPQLSDLFKSDLHPQRVIQTLELYTNTTIEPDRTLIVFDEVQAVERGITSLKYFCEEAPQYHVAAAGSLLGVSLHEHESFPVGKVDFIDIYPMTFIEFLRAMGKDKMAQALSQANYTATNALHDSYTALLRQYLYVGGMPEVVQAWVDSNDIQAVRNLQHRIITSYQSDFSKHVPADQVPRMNLVWQSIPSQLAKENKKFVYGVLREGARAKDFEVAILWLENCGLLLKSYRITKPYMPLIAYQQLSAFKIFLVDVGLLGALANLDARSLAVGNEIFTEFKGALTEQYVMQELKANNKDYIGYWTNDRNSAEVDFIVQDQGEIYPIEAKATINTKAKSFKMFCEKYQPHYAYRTSLRPYREEEWMTNIPLYAIGQVGRQ